MKFWLCLLLLLATSVVAQDQADPVLVAMKQELARSFTNLKKASVQPYFLSYEVTDNHAIQIRASFGALMSSDDERTRVLDIDLRVGDYKLDNTHPMADAGRGPGAGQVQMPIDDGPDALRNALWFAT